MSDQLDNAALRERAQQECSGVMWRHQDWQSCRRCEQRIEEDVALRDAARAEQREALDLAWQKPMKRPCLWEYPDPPHAQCGALASVPVVYRSGTCIWYCLNHAQREVSGGQAVYAAQGGEP